MTAQAFGTGRSGNNGCQGTMPGKKRKGPDVSDDELPGFDSDNSAEESDETCKESLCMQRDPCIFFLKSKGMQVEVNIIYGNARERTARNSMEHE